MLQYYDTKKSNLGIIVQIGTKSLTKYEESNLWKI